jgi:hypothetical protein
MWGTDSNHLQMSWLTHSWCDGDSFPRGVGIPVPKTRQILTRQVIMFSFAQLGEDCRLKAHGFATAGLWRKTDAAQEVLKPKVRAKLV